MTVNFEKTRTIVDADGRLFIPMEDVYVLIGALNDMTSEDEIRRRCDIRDKALADFHAKHGGE